MLNRRKKTAPNRDRPGRRISWLGCLWAPETAVLVASIVVLVVASLPGDAGIVKAPLPMYAATLALFFTPGLSVCYLLFADGPSGLSRAPVAFVVSAGIFGLPGVLALMLHRTLGEYLFFCGAVLAGSLVALVLSIMRRRESTAREGPLSEGFLLWAPFVGLAGVLAFVSANKAHSPNQDTWLYLTYTRDLLEKSPLGLYLPYSEGEVTGFSRLALNGWLLEQAAFAHVSGLDPVTLTLDYLAPTLVVVSLLAFYALALMLFQNGPVALLAGCIYALFLLVNLDASPTSFGGEFVARITEDKFVARFVFLPVALGAAVTFLRGRGLRYLGLFFFVCLSSAAVHPLGPVFVGVSVLGLCLLHPAILRQRAAWARVGGLVGALLGVVLPPAAYLLLTTGALIPRDPGGSGKDDALRLAGAEAQEHLLVLGDGSFIMHPSLILDPFVVAAYLLGVPYLLWRYKDPAAQLLLGVLFVIPLLVYVPPVATTVGNFIGPWHLWRLSWPLPLAALLSLGWAASGLLGYAGDLLRRSVVLGRVSPLLPFVFLALLAWWTVPTIQDGVRSAKNSEELPQGETDCRDPSFREIQETMDDPGTVLAPTKENVCTPAHLANVTIVSYRGQGLPNGQDTQEEQAPLAEELPRGAADVNRFFEAEALDKEMIGTLGRYGVDHVLVRAGSPLELQLRHLPGFEAVDVSEGRYRAYGLDQATVQALRTSPLVAANGLLNQGDFEAATEAYGSVLATGGEEEWFLAYVGLGRAYAEQSLHAEAAASYEQATALEPEEAYPYELLARSYAADGYLPPAVDALERAVALNPDDARLHQDLGKLLSKVDTDDEALEQYRMVVEMYPEVPEYRAQLGTALLEAGREKEGGEQLEKAVALDPLSAGVHGLAGSTYQDAGLLVEAKEQYERARELDPDNQAHALHLGEVYAELSTREGGDEAYFEKAEETLRRAEELALAPGQEKQRARALVALGDLYAGWDRTREATAAYQKALELEPGFRKAGNRLKRLEGA